MHACMICNKNNLGEVGIRSSAQHYNVYIPAKPQHDRRPKRGNADGCAFVCMWYMDDPYVFEDEWAICACASYNIILRATHVVRRRMHGSCRRCRAVAASVGLANIVRWRVGGCAHARAHRNLQLRATRADDMHAVCIRLRRRSVSLNGHSTPDCGRTLDRCIRQLMSLQRRGRGRPH